MRHNTSQPTSDPIPSAPALPVSTQARIEVVAPFNAPEVRAKLKEFADSLGIMDKIALKSALTGAQLDGLQSTPNIPDPALKAHLDNLFGSLSVDQKTEIADALDDSQRTLLREAGYPV